MLTLRKRQGLDDKPGDGLTPAGMNIKQTIQVIRPQNRQQRLQIEVAQITRLL